MFVLISFKLSFAQVFSDVIIYLQVSLKLESFYILLTFDSFRLFIPRMISSSTVFYFIPVLVSIFLMQNHEIF